MKLLKLALLLLLKTFGVFALARRLSRRGIRILCYHGLWIANDGYPGDGMFMSRSTFEKRLAFLRRMRLPVISLDAAINGMAEGSLQDCSVVITIDDGWYSSYQLMLPALKKNGFTATIYCDTANLISEHPVPHVMARYIQVLVERGLVKRVFKLNQRQESLMQEALSTDGEIEERLARLRRFAESVSLDFGDYLSGKVFHYMNPQQLKEAFVEGFDIQLHTHNHTMHDLDPVNVVAEINENRFWLSKILGVDPMHFRHFCYPSGACAPSLEEALNSMKLLSATTVEQAIAYADASRFFLPRILDGEQLTLLEFEAELSGVMDYLRRFRNSMCCV